MFHLTITSGLDVISGDMGDVRLVQYILNSNVSQAKQLHDVWNLPMYHPVEGILAYSDTYLLPTIIYALLALVAKSAIVFPLWLIVLAIGNYLSMYFVTAKLLKAKVIWAVLASYIFAFPMVQAIQLNHPQSLLRMFIPFGLYALLRFMQSRHIRYLIYYSLFIMLSLYCAVYIAYFMLLFGALALAIWTIYELIVVNDGSYFVDFTCTKKEITLFVITIIGIAYIGNQYIQLAPKTGGNEEIVMALAPKVISYIGYPQGSIVAKVLPFVQSVHEDNSDLIVTPGIVYAGLFMATCIGALIERQRVAIIVMIVVGLLYFLTTKYGSVLPWGSVAPLIPGAYIIRAVGRIWMITYPATIMVAIMIFGRYKGSQLLPLAILTIFIIENLILSTPVFRISQSEKNIQSVSSQIPDNCDVAILTLADYIVDGKISSLYRNIDAMHATLRRNMKLVGGYTGYRPPYYPYVIDMQTAKPLLRSGERGCEVR